MLLLFSPACQESLVVLLNNFRDMCLFFTIEFTNKEIVFMSEQGPDTDTVSMVAVEMFKHLIFSKEVSFKVYHG